MKKLALFLLLALPHSAYAQKNEVAFTPGIVRYQTTSTFERGPGFSITSNNGYQFAFAYYRNIKWLQLGAGVEYGPRMATFEKIHSTAHPESSLELTQVVADRYRAGYVRIGVRYSDGKWSVYAGPTAGFMSVGTSLRFKWVKDSNGVSTVTDDNKTSYSLTGWYKGGYAGAAYRVLPRLAVSVDMMARYANLDQASPLYSVKGPTYTGYNRLTMYNFGIGVRYRF